MPSRRPRPSTVRRLAVAWIGTASLPVAWPARAGAPAATPTPACDDGEHPTPRQTAGPFHKPQSPHRASLREPGDDGPRLVLTGRVIDTRCGPLAGATLDVWHADTRGRYDNDGYRFRGHLFADAQGRYRLETTLPGLYPGRMRHIHVRAQPAGGRALTTQLYFPGEAGNRRDGLFDDALLMAITRDDARDGIVARFDFVLQSA